MGKGTGPGLWRAAIDSGGKRGALLVLADFLTEQQRPGDADVALALRWCASHKIWPLCGIPYWWWMRDCRYSLAQERRRTHISCHLPGPVHDRLKGGKFGDGDGGWPYATVRSALRGLGLALGWLRAAVSIGEA